VGYARPSEALAERFHMDEDTLRALNPGADFGRAGAVIVVAQVGAVDLPRVDHIEVDKAHAAVRAYDKAGTEIAFMPATVGSTDRPSPSGTHKVKGVARNPKYTYDPKKLTWGPKDQGKFVVPSGPNNPVGAVWIDLDAPSYGLHGTPEPKEIGKTASHGCVRMTNWDALQLAAAVRPGVVVRFINSRES
jgi:lipoprotein-anchoring transpeptidase ErfK/SrfK